MIDGTIIVRLLERRDPAAVAARTEHGALPTVEEFTTAVADATTGDPAPGRTVYIGGADYLLDQAAGSRISSRDSSRA